MTDKSGSGKKPGTATKPSQAKDQKSARSRTIELTAEDVTPPEKKAAEVPEAPKSKTPKTADKPAGDREEKKPQKAAEKAAEPDQPVKSSGSAAVVLIAAFAGALLALAVVYGLLFFKVISLDDGSKAQMLAAISGLETRMNAAGTQNNERLGALAGKAQSRSQVHADMLAKTNADLAALKGEMTALGENASALAVVSKNTAASLAAINTASQSALKATKTLGARLDMESKSRAELGPHIAANTAQTQKQAVEITEMSKGLESAITASGRLKIQVEDLFKGLKDIEKAVVEAGAISGGEPSSAGVRISLLGNKFKRLEQDMKGLSNTLQSMPAVPPDVTPQISVLEKSLNRVSKGVANLGARNAVREDALLRVQDKAEALGREVTRIGNLDKRLEGLSERLVSLQAALGVVGKAADTLKISNTGSSGALSALSKQIGSVREELAGRIEGLEKVMAEISNAESKLSAIDARLSDVKSVQGALAVQQKLAAKVQSANRLQRDLLGGSAFKTALFAFIELAPDVKVPESLTALAADGVSTPNKLRIAFNSLKEDFEAQNILEGGSGLMGKIMQSAGSVVSVRRTGPTTGVSSGAIASRVSAHLEKGDFGTALSEASGFEGGALEKAEPWINALRARLDAEAFAADLGALVYSGGKGE